MNIVQIQPIFQKERGHGTSTFISQMKLGMEKLNHAVDKIFLDFSLETIDESVAEKINSYDFCFVHDLPNKKSNDKFNEAFIDLIANKVKTKKVLFLNMHKKSSLRMNHKAMLVEEFISSFDAFVSFSRKCETLSLIENIIGKDELDKKFIAINQPYFISEKDSESWFPYSKKWNAMSYFGRYHPIKDVERMLRSAKTFQDAGIQLNIFGIDQTPSIIGVQDLKYHYDENGNRSKSTLVKWVTKTFLKKYGYKDGLCPYLIDFPKNKHIIYCFGPYRYENGMIAMRSSGFGCDFFNIENKQYGTNLEYAIYEIVKNGCVPVLDYDVGNEIHFFKEDGSRSEKSIYDEKLGVFLKKDLSNIDEVINEMKDIFSSEEKYESFRKRVFTAFRIHLMPKNSCGKLLNDLQRI